MPCACCQSSLMTRDRRLRQLCLLGGLHTIKLVLLPAFFIGMLFVSPPLQAQAPQAGGTAVPGLDAKPIFAFDIDIQAPGAVQDYLRKHLELQRYRELSDLDEGELTRLLSAARRDAQELLGTLGFFSPTIDLGVHDTPGRASAPREVVIRVDPGGQVKIHTVNIEFSGPMATDTSAAERRDAIRSFWSLPPGQAFTQAAWDDAKAQALRRVTAHRYPAGQVASSQADIDPDTLQANLSLQLDSGPPYRLGSFQVNGLQRYDPALVWNLARLDTGMDYDQAQLVEAQQRLADSGYFDSALISMDITGDPAAAPVNVQVREAKLQKVVLGVGASTDSGPRLSLEHTHHKLPGIGWRAVTKLAADRSKTALDLTLTAPPDTDGWRWMTSALLERHVVGSYEVDRQRLRLGRSQSGDRIDRNYYLQYDRSRSAGTGTSARTALDADALTANAAWTYRQFDSLPFPASGYGVGVELGAGTTLGSNRQPFLRTQVHWLGLWPLDPVNAGIPPAARKGRIAVRAEAGGVFARSGTPLPSTQLFLTGGDTTVRGYAFERIGTELPDGSVTAGRYMAAGSVEWQRPIVVNGSLTEWESSVFMDAGSVADQTSAFKPKVGLGAGVRWKSPVGPLQIDLAYGVAVKKFRLHLSVGFTF